MSGQNGTLAGKRVLITGGGTGVGADMAHGFASAGADVVISGRRAEPLQEVASAFSNIRWLIADVTDEASVKAMFAEAGACDIVIANAGAADSATIGRTTLKQWDAMIAVNLTGVFLTFREGLAQFNGWGRLIAVSSTAGIKGYAKIAPYAAAKHGVIGLVRSMAMEVAKSKVTVNAICPGYLDTPMTDVTIRNIVEKTGRTPEAARAALESMSPQGRLFMPDEVTSTALWLASDGARGVTGQAISISGGEV